MRTIRQSLLQTWGAAASVLAFMVLAPGSASLRAQPASPKPGATQLPPPPPLLPPAIIDPGGFNQPSQPIPNVPTLFRPIPQPAGLPGTSIGTTTVSRPVIRVINGPQYFMMPTNVLAFDEEFKEISLKVGEDRSEMFYAFTNVTSSNIVINAVRPSCGCTIAKLPPMPWTVEPATRNEMTFHVDVRGKRGTLTKTITVDTSAGVKSLAVRVQIPDPPALAHGAGAASMGDRVRNLQIAAADRQAVFRNDCAKCHAEPTVGKKGKELYGAACGICHDAEHRASMVPDLTALKHPTNRQYWHQWIAIGKPGTLMPAFSQAQGGPLTDEQIESLVSYLEANPPAAAARAEAPHTALTPVVAQ